MAESGAGRAVGSTPGPHIRTQINRANGGERSRLRKPGLQLWEIKPQTSVESAQGGWGTNWRNSSLTGEVVEETHRGLECAQAHPLGEPAAEGPSLIVGIGVKD